MTVVESHPGPVPTLKSPAPGPVERALPAYYPDVLAGLLLLAAPFLLFPQGYGLLALLVLPGLWCFRWALTGRIIPRTPLDGPVLVILVMVLLSLGITFDLSFSIGKISGLLWGIALFYAVVDLTRSTLSLKRVITLFILAGIGIALVSILGTRWPAKFPLIQPVLDQAPALLRGLRNAEEGLNPNQVGGVLIFFVPLQFMLAVYRLGRFLSHEPREDAGRSRLRRLGELLFICLSLAVTGSVLFLTQSRGGLGGLAVGLVVMAALRSGWGRLAAVAGALTLAWLAYTGAFADLSGPGLETEVAGTISLAGRVEIWSRAVQGIGDFPLGMGMNNFRRVVPILYPLFSVSPTQDIAHAHNHLLQAGLDLGIPGMIAYLALWLQAGRLLLGAIRRPGRCFYRAVALGLTGGLAAHFVYGLTDTVALGAKPGFVLWWTLGLVVAVSRLVGQDCQPQEVRYV